MKKYLILAIIFAFSFTLTSCSKSENKEIEQNTQEFDKQGRRMPDFGQPEEEADLRGLVTKITGNEVTILKIERRGINREELSDEERAEMEERRASFGGVPGSGMGMGMRGGAGRPETGDEESQTAMLERMKEMSTGEEKIVIPVGIKILKLDTESDEANMVEASLSDIKANTMVTVWLNSDVEDRKVAEFVLVSRNN